MPGSLFRLQQRAGIEFWSLPLWGRWGCRIVFTCRAGGVSRPPFASLNLGLATSDKRERVLANRRKLVRAAGLGPLSPVVVRQSHEANIREAKRADAGRGWSTLRTAFRRTDGLVTAVPGLPLAVTTADCLPVLLADRRGRAVAAVHAGWRGLTNGVIPAALQVLRRKYGIDPADLRVAIGPGIGPRAFIVKGEARRKLRRIDPSAARSGSRFDLWKAAVRILKSEGVNSKQIFVLRQCTASQPHSFFSYRRDGKTGRMLGVIQLLPSRKSR